MWERLRFTNGCNVRRRRRRRRRKDGGEEEEVKRRGEGNMEGRRWRRGGEKEI